MLRVIPHRCFALCVIALLLSPIAMAQDRGRERDNRGPRHALPAFAISTAFNVILGRPTDHSVVLSILSYKKDVRAVITYGSNPGTLTLHTPEVTLSKAKPQEWLLERLSPATQYHYRIEDASTRATLASGSFYTQRLPASSFQFTITADSHLDQNTDPLLYQRTLANALQDRPDFHIDLGDTFMTEKHESRASAAQQYLAQRYFFGQVGHSMPLFLVIGNHDGEEVRQLRDGPNSLGVWAIGMRKQYFPNPVSDAFYSASAAPDPLGGQLQDYFAWHWGDALFVVLNPYWHAPPRRSDERWGLSLGDAQYRWLKRTLEESHARYKLVFVHQLVGGIDRQGRGGIEGIEFGEWGGKNADGSNGLQTHRPGWNEPIHSMLVRNQVSIVFHGHDHLFAKQDLDGIVYQEVPQPGHPGTSNARNAAEYGYRSGTIMGYSGHMRISIAPDKMQADYVGVELASDGQPGPNNGQVHHTYSIAPSNGRPQ